MAEIKNFKTFEEQLQILKDRGLIITNEKKLIYYLTNYNYYRLSGYSLKYRDKDTFKAFIYDENIYQAFSIDEEMRLMLLKLCFLVESKIKTKIAYVLGQEEALAYLDDSLYNNYNVASNDGGTKKDEIFKDAFEYVKKNNAKIYDHHRDKYDGKYPIWVIIHYLTFGNVVKLYNLLKDEYKMRISYDFTKYIISMNDFEQYIAAINCLRNACAHSDRLINKGLSKSIPLFCINKNVFQYITIGNDLFKKSSTNLYGYLIALVQLLSNESKSLEWLYDSMVSLFIKYPLIKPEDYGLIGDWWRNIKLPVKNYLTIKNINHNFNT